MIILEVEDLPSNRNYTVYFIFSSEQMQFQKNMAEKMGKTYTVGRVIVGGVRKNFTTMSRTNTTGYSDEEIVASGEVTKMKYTMPKFESAKSRS